MHDAKDLALLCAKGAVEIKAEDVRIFDVRGLSPLTDYVVLCTANSIPHLRACLREIDGYVYEHCQQDACYKDDNSQSLWGVLDYIDVIVHIQHPESREFYGLDKMWSKAPEVPFNAEEC